VDPHVVIGTAGHIDHGKTALVLALTGVDTDRLAEEKARGITIDLGFAPLALPGLAASVVDVPGHEGFIRNMVAGATGVDCALLVVASDEGVMPQTREHVAILRFLGVTRGVIALTKSDLATDPDWRSLVAEDAVGLVREAVGTAWPVVEVSAVTGAGMDALRAALAEAARGVTARPETDRFRLPVDRAFSLPGAGTIVTGTVWSGVVREGDRVRVLPAMREARVRSVQVHGAAATTAGPGRRAALALVGVERAEVERGAVVVTGEGWRGSDRFDAEVVTLAGEDLRLRQRVRIHHGTAEVLARVARTAPGPAGSLCVRFNLEGTLVLRSGDRFVIRAYSPVTTIGGGVVADPWVDTLAARRRGPLPEPRPGGDAALAGWLVTRRGPIGMTEEGIAVAGGFDEARLAAALAGPERVGLRSDGSWYVGAGEVGRAAELLTGTLDAFHAGHPLEPGMSHQAWRSVVHGPLILAELAESDLVAAGSIVRNGAVVRRPQFDPGSSTGARAGGERVLEALRAAGAEPPSVAELASLLAGTDVPSVLRLLARAGQVTQVAERYYASEVLQGERDRLVSVLTDLGKATPAELRERLGRSRKWLIPFLEWADREGVTIRDGDGRRLHPRTGA